MQKLINKYSKQPNLKKKKTTQNNGDTNTKPNPNI